MAKKLEEAPQEWDSIEIGDQVKHAKWGVGTVLFRSGMGSNAKAIVVFPEEGQKKLMLKYAKLKKVGSTSLKSVEKLKAETAPPVRPTKAIPAVADDEEVDLDLAKIGPGDDGLLDDEEVVGFDDEDEEFAAPDEQEPES
jgi:hypothetical protein